MRKTQFLFIKASGFFLVEFVDNIVGVLSLDKSPIDPAVLVHMARVGYAHSISAAYCWIGKCVGFSHFALDKTPKSSKKCLPLSNYDNTCWITADARIDNRQELVCFLIAQGSLLEKNPTDAELILAAYTQWGNQCPQHLIGAFAFAIWDSRTNSLFCARDPMGNRPFYYHYSPQQIFLFASKCRQLLQHPSVRHKLDERMIAAHLFPCPGQPEWSFFTDIRRLPPAHTLYLGDSGLCILRYWDINPEHEIRYRSDKEYEEHFRTIALESVACCLRNSGPTGILLSGGIDSGTVASIAGHLTSQQHNAPDLLWALSWTFDKLIECNERSYSDQIVKAYNLIPEYVLGDTYWLFSDYEESNTIPDDPTFLMSSSLLRATIKRAQELGITTMMSGSGGNSLVGGDIPNYVELLNHFHWRTLWRHLAQHQQLDNIQWPQLLWRYLIQPILLQQNHSRHTYQMAPWISSSFVQRIDLEGIRKKSLPHRPFREVSKLWRYQATTNELENRTVIAESGLYREGNIDYRLPWRDHRLLEFIMAIPSDQIWRGGERKSIVRRSMRGILPEPVRINRNIGTIQPLCTLGLRHHKKVMIENWLQDPIIAQHGFADRNILQEEFNRYCNGLRGEFPLNYTLQLEMWLRLLL